MLQRAASNAYSWWWASHVRTKQSKWLEENLRDMEGKITRMLKIIENSGDTFAQRAEMYYRKRPELISYVEDSYRSYRALAERYDHLSKALQSANHVVGTIFPEVQFAIDEEDDDNEEENKPTSSASSADGLDKAFKAPKPNIPEVPSMPKEELWSQPTSFSRKGQLNGSTSSRAAAPQSSGLTKEEALKEIDALRKEILALQTEKEFVQSVCERCQTKYRGIENNITEMQAEVSRLQDEFGIDNVIHDNEARTRMASTALKSCQDSLVNLQETQAQSVEEAEVENQRSKEVHQKLRSLKGERLPKQTDLQEIHEEAEAGQQDIESLPEKIKKELEAESRSPFNMSQLTELIDELVEKVVNLETEISSQGALVNRLRSETDGLQSQEKSLEEDREILKENSESVRIKLKKLERELHKLKNLNQNVKDQNNNLQTQFIEASCNVDHPSEKLPDAKPDEADDAGMAKEMGDALDSNADKEVEEHEEKLAPGIEMEKEEMKHDDPVSNYVKAKGFIPTQKLQMMHERRLTLTHDKDLFEIESNIDTELEELIIVEEDQPNWRQLFVNGMKNRERLLFDEYGSVLKNYKDVRKKLVDVEKKNRDGFYELALQIRELKDALATRDEEIQFLRMVGSPQRSQDDHHSSHSTKCKYPHWEGYTESMTRTSSFADYSFSSLGSPQLPLFDEHREESRGRTSVGMNRYSGKEMANEIKVKSSESPYVVSAVEEKIHSEIDDLLEENLEFWLRFSTSFHQIRKFQNSVQDIKMELLKLQNNMKHDGSGKTGSLMSEARSIYKHLRKIQTELTLWLENNSVLKDELQARDRVLCNIEEEVSRVSKSSSRAEEPEISEYQAAKFQGEILRIKHENKKVGHELQVGVDRVGGLKVEVEKILAKLDEELGVGVSKRRTLSNRAKVPLRSFLFGVKIVRQKQQKQSLFSCASPAFQKQYSDMAAFGKLSK